MALFTSAFVILDLVCILADADDENRCARRQRADTIDEGFEPPPLPAFAHVPNVLAPDGRKLSKRHGATSIAEFRKQGYLPEALLNFLAFLGWAPGEGEEQEIFTPQELAERFSLEHVNKAGAVFAYDKLEWMNGVYIRALTPQASSSVPCPFLRRICQRR
jgi:glutamyl/glutaminyl-tRNA synthetase